MTGEYRLQRLILSLSDSNRISTCRAMSLRWRGTLETSGPSEQLQEFSMDSLGGEPKLNHHR